MLKPRWRVQVLAVSVGLLGALLDWGLGPRPPQAPAHAASINAGSPALDPCVVRHRRFASLSFNTALDQAHAPLERQCQRGGGERCTAREVITPQAAMCIADRDAFGPGGSRKAILAFDGRDRRLVWRVDGPDQPPLRLDAFDGQRRSAPAAR